MIKEISVFYLNGFHQTNLLCSNIFSQNNKKRTLLKDLRLFKLKYILETKQVTTIWKITFLVTQATKMFGIMLDIDYMLA